MFATIDIGTNSVLLLIADLPSPPSIKKSPPAPLFQSGVCIVTDQARITRLGEGLHQSESFLPSAMKRTLQALEEYNTLCEKHHVKKIICVGTAAFRKAQNGQEFISEIQKRFGWETRIISGEEEAGLSYLSVEHDFSAEGGSAFGGGDRYQNLVTLDIGGGSTEIISKEGGVSLELGTVVLTERHLRHAPPTESEILEIDEIILSQLGRVTRPSSVTLVALAGTATTLSSINQKLAIWDPSKIQGSQISMKELDQMISMFRRMTHDALRMTPGMVPGREDTLLAGALILKAVMEKLGAHFVIVSDRGLRYGLFYQEFLNARIL